MVTARQKPILDTQKIIKQSEHTSKESHQITKGESKRKEHRGTTKQKTLTKCQ